MRSTLQINFFNQGAVVGSGYVIQFTEPVGQEGGE